MNAPLQAPPNPFGRGILNGPADFIPDWDVPSIGAQATAQLLGAIGEINGRADVDPDRKIQVLLGPPGYGKTHLFGRLGHQLRGRVLFVFVPQIQDLSRPLDHIRHHVVLSIFESAEGTRPPLARALARLCRPSFIEYLSILPRPLDTQYAGLLDRLKHDEEAVWEIIDAVHEIQPFRTLGDSLARRFEQLDGNVLRALALGWSPAIDPVRRWLRGESLAEDQARRLGLPDIAPDPVDVMEAIATLMIGQMPVVLCIDQLDALRSDPDAPLRFSNAVMGLRSKIPNLLIIMSCLEVEWKDVESRVTNAFRERMLTSKLAELSESEAAELIRRRLQFWPGGPPEPEPWWPIDEASIGRLLAAPQRPRGLLKTCEEAYQEWANDGDLNRRIDLKPVVVPLDPDLDQLFAVEWDRTLDEVGKDRSRGLENAQDQRLARALKEGLNLLACTPRGLRAASAPKSVREGPVPQVESNPNPNRYSFEAILESANGPKSLIIALEVNHNARQFSFYFNAIIDSLGSDSAGAVLITSKAQVPTGPTTKRAMEAETRKNRLRTITLTDYREDFARLECFLTLLERSAARDLLLAGRTIEVEEYRKLVVKSEVLADLRLFDQMFNGWVLAPAGTSERVAPEDLTTPGPESMTQPEAVETPVMGYGTEGGNGDRAAVGDRSAEESTSDTNGQLADDPRAEERLEWAFQGEELIIRRLGELGARVRAKAGAAIGPTFARFLVTPYPATTISKIRNRAEDLKVGLEVDALPLVSSQAGAISIDVQLPERFRRSIRLADLGSGPPMAATGAPVFAVGQDVTGQSHWLDFADPNTCHLLVAGTTGSGKSEFLKAMLAALARRLGPDRIRFAVVDPKQVTFNFGDRAGPFLLRPVVNGTDDAITLVHDCFEEAEHRFAQLKARRLEDLAQWQAVDAQAPPRILLVFDEFADLMADKAAKKELEGPLKRLGAKARAAGVHLVLATQRPEASVVTPLLRSNLPARICFRVASPADSNLILKKPDGADLLGRGDLFWQRGAGLIRLQSPFVARDELDAALFPAVAATQP